MTVASTLTFSVVETIIVGNPERGYELCFNELMNNPSNKEEINALLGLLSAVVGNHEVSDMYFSQSKIALEQLNANFNRVMKQINNMDIKKKWDNYRRDRNQAELIRMSVTAPLCKGDVLEIGCANGDLSVFIASHGSNLFGVDVDPVAIDLARHKVAKLGIDTCCFQVGNGYQLQFEDNIFDTVVVAEVLEHVDDPKRILQEAYRVCKPGGTIIVSVPNGYSIPDPDHCNIFTRPLLNGLVDNAIGSSLTWNDHIPNQWIMGTVKKPIMDVEVPYTSVNIKELFLPQPFTLPKSDKLVSVIIATYNRSKYIADSVESVLQQTHQNIEVIVVDDGSNEPTKEALAPYLDRITYIYKENGGKSSAVNEAIKHVNGDFIWVFDDDDIALPLKLELQLKRFELNPNLGMVHTRGISFNGATHQVDLVHDLSPLSEQLDFKQLVRGCFIHGPTVIFKRECLRVIGEWDVELIRAQDYDYWLRLARYFEMEYLPVPTVRYRTHNGVRGSEQSPVTYNDIIAKTNDYEQIIFKKLYRTVQISEIYKDVFKSDNVVLMLEAFIERALVYAGKSLTDEIKLDIKIVRENAHNLGNPCFSQEAIQNIEALANIVFEKGWTDKELLTELLGVVNIISLKD
ncbi:glycosyltransferase [Paenibacillus sp. SC116]|uniref:glycosyltransferase n=1 Tax=Paenibacillus sp. SC116 TaxID=2968986 RepID=UPI00215A50AC|nr:glycosyltransferase [Paenibacillus sp. SC116]MCR8844813.1 glycosyltransferase [Paenibacillus sp. SC116]